MSGGQLSCNFTPDPKIQVIAEAFANDAVTFSKENLKINLDWSEISIEEVERALAMLSSSYKTTSPPPCDDQVQGMGRIFGSYIGEVYRRHHGGEWGIVELNEQSLPGLEAKSGRRFWPWAKACSCIKNGDEDDIR